MEMLAFSWNMSQARFCEDSAPESACSIPDFWVHLVDKIEFYKPTLVSFAFQESSDFDITGYMYALHYTVIYREFQPNKCQISIFSRTPGISVLETKTCNSNFLNWRGKTESHHGTLIILRLPNNLRWGVVNICLGSHNILKSFEKILTDLVYTPPMEYVTILGSFALPPTSCPIEQTLKSASFCMASDIFSSALPNLLLEEGPENTGPNFAPTCYLSIKRESSSEDLRLTSIDRRINLPPGPKVEDFVDRNKAAWCDRIFYATFQPFLGIKLKCFEYGRIDDPETNIRLSNHAIVYSLLVLE